MFILRPVTKRLFDRPFSIEPVEGALFVDGARPMTREVNGADIPTIMPQDVEGEIIEQVVSSVERIR